MSQATINYIKSTRPEVKEIKNPTFNTYSFTRNTKILMKAILDDDTNYEIRLPIGVYLEWLGANTIIN